MPRRRRRWYPSRTGAWSIDSPEARAVLGDGPDEGLALPSDPVEAVTLLWGPSRGSEGELPGLDQRVLEAPDDDILAGLAREFAEEPEAVTGAEPKPQAKEARRKWRRLSRAVPRDVLHLVQTIDVPMYRVEGLEAIELQLYGWRGRRKPHPHSPGDSVAVSPAEVRRSYNTALAEPRRGRTLQVVRHVVDRVKAAGYLRKLTATGERSNERPEPSRVQNGSLLVFDPTDRRTPTYGVRSTLEATPVEVPEYVIRVLRTFGSHEPALILDLTAGSSTDADVAATYGGETVEADLAPLNDVTLAHDLRDIRRWSAGSRKFDLIFLHPASVGLPSPVRLADGVRADRDLAFCHPDEWVEVVSQAVNDALGLLQEGHGLLSVLIPEGVRNHQNVLPLPGIADRIVAGLPDDAFIVERLQIRWERAARQVSLGRNRVPTIHLLIAREGPWPC